VVKLILVICGYKMIYNKIIILISFIILIGCESRKEKTPSPSGGSTQSIVKTVTKKPKVKNQKVIITAEIFSETDYDNENLIAEIINCGKSFEDDFCITSVTGCANNQIIFSPIRVNLNSLRVRVECPDKPVCYSPIFDTKDKKDKTIVVELPDGVTLRGKAVKTESKSVKKFLLRASPKKKNLNRFSPGQFDGEIVTDPLGNFECPGFIKASYRFEARYENFAPIIKHVRRFSPSNCKVDFVFQEMCSVTISGKIFSAVSLEPLEGVRVELTASVPSNVVKRVTTDISGTFVFETMRWPNQNIGELNFAKDGYGSSIVSIPRNYDGKEILIKLQYASQIIGMVKKEDGTLVSGIKVMAKCNVPKENPQIQKRNEKFLKMLKTGSRYDCISAPTDADGQFVISNVAAPATYKLSIISELYSLAENKFHEKNIVRTRLDSPAVCDLIVYEEAKIFIKVVDEDGNSVPEYHLRIDADVGEQQGIRDQKVDQTKAEWFRVMPHGWQRTFKTILSFKARYQNMLSETIKNIQWGDGETRHIILTLKAQEPQITGRFYYPDGVPVPNETVDAKAKQSCDEVRVFSDADGYFEIIGLQAGENEIVNLSAEKNGAFADTNVINGSRDVPLLLQGPRCVIGRVFYENLETPATNFVVREERMVFRDTVDIEFSSEDGRFEIKPYNHIISGRLELLIEADGYATKEVHGMIGKKVVCDVGDIILRKTGATLKGKVIDHLGNPVSTEVSLRTTVRNQQSSALTETNPEDGSYEFVNLPGGKVNVYARLTRDFAEGKVGPIELKNGEITIAPDIIIWTTNLIEATITLVMPDASPAANSFIFDFSTMTDSRGKVTLWLPEGYYPPLNIRLGCRRLPTGYTFGEVLGKYLSEPFDVTPSTTHLTLQIEKSGGISGFVMKDGNPFSGEIKFYGKISSGSCDVREGNFTIKIPPGQYFVLCSRLKSVTDINLKKDGQNNINFQTGAGKVTVSPPQINNGQWKISITHIHLGYGFDIGATFVNKNSDKIVFDSLPAGEYSVSAYRFGKDATNLQTSLTIGNGEHKNVSF